MIIYLVGPIDQVTPEWAIEWRRVVKESLTGWTVLDPTAGKDLHAAGVNDTLYTPAEIVEADLAMVEQADVLLVDWRELDDAEISRQVYEFMPMPQVLRFGTICECKHAHDHGKRIIGFGTLRRGYWAQYYIREHYDSLAEAIAMLMEVGA